MKEAGVLKQIKDYCEQVLSRELFIWRQNTQGTFLKSRGAYVFHGLAGVPDLVGMLKDGRFIGVEVKRTGKKSEQRPAQKEFEIKCKNFKGIYILTDSIDDFINQYKAVK